MSVQITLDRMDNDEGIPLKERQEAKALLLALSWLDRTKVPLALLTGHDIENLAGRRWKTVTETKLNSFRGPGLASEGKRSSVTTPSLPICITTISITSSHHGQTHKPTLPFSPLSTATAKEDVTKKPPLAAEAPAETNDTIKKVVLNLPNAIRRYRCKHHHHIIPHH
jgi:hypothetical protein